MFDLGIKDINPFFDEESEPKFDSSRPTLKFKAQNGPLESNLKNYAQVLKRQVPPTTRQTSPLVTLYDSIKEL